MNRLLYGVLRPRVIGLLALFLPVVGMAADGMSVIESDYGVVETETRLVDAIEGKGLTVMARVDHRANAHSVGLDMSATRLVIFGNPKAGTALMQCAPTVAIDLPMKMLIWAEGGTVRVGYNTPDYLVERHDIGDCAAPVQATMRKALAGLARQAAGRP